MKEKVRYYNSYTDDFVTSKNQNCALPEDYEWIRRGPIAGLMSFITYAAAIVIGAIYSFFHLHLKYANRKKMRGAFIFGNHTQPVGDIFIPAFASFPTRIYVVVSPANYGIPGVRKILPYLGALPTASTISETKKFTSAVREHIENGKNVVIYPEAHVWEYYTGIRPYPASSFKLAAKLRAPVYCTTVTYRRRRFGKKPKTVVYTDGPFVPPEGKSVNETAQWLRDEVYRCMAERSCESTYEYIKYKARNVQK